MSQSLRVKKKKKCKGRIKIRWWTPISKCVYWPVFAFTCYHRNPFLLLRDLMNLLYIRRGFMSPTWGFSILSLSLLNTKPKLHCPLCFLLQYLWLHFCFFSYPLCVVFVISSIIHISPSFLLPATEHPSTIPSQTTPQHRYWKGGGCWAWCWLTWCR